MISDWVDKEADDILRIHKIDGSFLGGVIRIAIMVSLRLAYRRGLERGAVIAEMQSFHGSCKSGIARAIRKEIGI